MVADEFRHQHRVLNQIAEEVAVEQTVYMYRLRDPLKMLRYPISVQGNNSLDPKGTLRSFP